MKEKDFTIKYVGETPVGDELKIPDKNFEGKGIGYKSVTGDKIVSYDAGSVNTAAIEAAAVTASKISYEEVTVTVTTGNPSGTGTATSGSTIIGWRPNGNVDQLVDSITISGTTVTVTLAANATANNNFVVILLKA